MATPQRSPKYPFIPIEKALERAKQLYDAEGRSAAPVQVVVGAWEYSPKSSGGQQTIGALKGYGLLDESGSGAARMLKLSDLALRILLDERPDSTEKVRNVKIAALNPPQFSKLWNQWKGDKLPSEANMKHTLIFEHKFPEKTARDFIKVFTQTIEFAGLRESPNDSSMTSDSQGFDNSEQEAPVTGRSAVVNFPSEIGQTAAVKTDVLHLDEGIAKLQWPNNISKSSAKDLEDWLALALRRIKRAAESADSNGGSGVAGTK